jgi:hypothetical protein
MQLEAAAALYFTFTLPFFIYHKKYPHGGRMNFENGSDSSAA